MVTSCCVIGCVVRGAKDSEFSMFRFPNDGERRKQWIRKIKRANWKPSAYSRVCSKHFIDGRPTEANPCPELELGYELPVGKVHHLASKKQVAEVSPSPSPSPSKAQQRAQSTTSPSHRQRRILKRICQSEEHGEPASTSKKPSNALVAVSPSGARVFYQHGGIKVKEPTPKHRYRDPTNPTTPGSSAKKRLHVLDKQEKEQETKIRRQAKRRRLIGSDVVQEPLELPQSPTTAESSSSPPLEPFVLEPQVTGLNETFTDTDSQNEKEERARASSAPLFRGSAKIFPLRRHVSLSSLNKEGRTRLLLKYRKK